jgi:hypothetical protein
MNTIHDQNRTTATLGGLFPGLRRLTLFVAFEEADATAEPNYQQIIYTADAAADFRLDCSRDACSGGGFDFTPIVVEMVSSREAMAHGKLGCVGHLGLGAKRCALQAEFRIIID